MAVLQLSRPTKRVSPLWLLPRLREEAGKIVLDPAAVTPVSLYADEEIERLVGADRVSPRERAALRRRWGLKTGARRRGRG